MKNLLERLFGVPVISETALGENFVRLFEDAAHEEDESFTVSNKKSLTSALSSLGVAYDGEAEADVSLVTINFDNDEEYRQAIQAIFTPDAMHKLAEAGWVAERNGDRGMSNEAPDFRITFVEIPDMPDNDGDKAPDLKTVMKGGQKADTTLLKRDDKLNPVESDPKAKMGDRQTGVGKAKDGANPEGKPKGSTKRESVDALLPAPPIQEMTSVAAIPPVDSPAVGIAKRRRKRNTKGDVKKGD